MHNNKKIVICILSLLVLSTTYDNYAASTTKTATKKVPYAWICAGVVGVGVSALAIHWYRREQKRRAEFNVSQKKFYEKMQAQAEEREKKEAREKENMTIPVVMQQVINEPSTSPEAVRNYLQELINREDGLVSNLGIQLQADSDSVSYAGSSTNPIFKKYLNAQHATRTALTEALVGSKASAAVVDENNAEGDGGDVEEVVTVANIEYALHENLSTKKKYIEITRLYTQYVPPHDMYGPLKEQLMWQLIALARIHDW